VPEDTLINKIRKHERTGRPLGRESFVEQLETDLVRPLMSPEFGGIQEV
jgi:putative transposase